MGIEDLLEEYFASIDFLPLGEKIANIGRAIEVARKIGRRRQVQIPKELEFLQGLELKELNTITKLLRRKQDVEVKKIKEMKAVFAAFNSRISESQLKAISYPDEIKIISEKVDDAAGVKRFYFTSKRIKNWFKRNVPTGMLPFRDHMHIKEVENNILKFNAFGIAGYSINRQTLDVLSIQPLVFFENAPEKEERVGKGVNQPLKKAHLFMLFLILKQAIKRGLKRVTVFTGYIASHHPSEREVYWEIINIATEYIRTYDQAFFKKK